MLVTAWGAIRGHYDKEFQLTMSQRTLMLQTISFLLYLLCGATVFSHIEGWAFLDAVYWADFTLLTVGIGDYSPATHLGRSLLFPFAIGGIIILGLVIGSIRSLVLERGKQKMGARMVEKERRRLLKKIQCSKGNFLEPITDDKAASSMSQTSSKTQQGDPGHPSERERRRHEFHLMHKIQDDAARKRRWTSLLVSGTTWLVLWFAGAAIFEAAEYGQDWSYFDSLYFSYTSLLTIGYGDFYPQSNSGKAFFVFWSLLAVPSLTIVISSMGDTIVKGIPDLTLSVGNFTILPEERGVKANLKDTLNKLTRGRMFGESNKRVKDEEHEHENPHRKNDTESAAQQASRHRADQEESRAAQQAEGNDELPESRHEYHLVLAKEISAVIKHLNSSPPRKYTFDEWTWYLKVIGEDEASPATHRKAQRKRRPEGEGLGAAMVDGGRSGKWSWLGHRSPLMGSKEESEWVLERLTMTLRRELEMVRREELEGRGGGRRDGEGEGEGKREMVEHGFVPRDGKSRSEADTRNTEGK